MKSSILFLSSLVLLLESASAQAPPPSTKGVCYTQRGFFPPKSVKTTNKVATKTVQLIETTVSRPKLVSRPCGVADFLLTDIHSFSDSQTSTGDGHDDSDKAIDLYTVSNHRTLKPLPAFDKFANRC